MRVILRTGPKRPEDPRILVLFYGCLLASTPYTVGVPPPSPPIWEFREKETAGAARITQLGRRRRFGFPSFEFSQDLHGGGVVRVLVATVKFPFVATENCTVSWLDWVCQGLDVGFLSSAVKRYTLWESHKPSLTNDTGTLTVPIRASRVELSLPWFAPLLATSGPSTSTLVQQLITAGSPDSPRSAQPAALNSHIGRD